MQGGSLAMTDDRVVLVVVVLLEVLVPNIGKAAF
jgi:hypothetical protein